MPKFSGKAVQAAKEVLGSLILSETLFSDETTLEVALDSIKAVLKSLKATPNPGFQVLTDLTGTDFLEPKPQTRVHYLLHHPQSFEKLRLVVFVGREESLPSVVELWPGADWYERELYDLFGVKIADHPHLTRILMPDDWVGHPLRKDYPLTELPVQFKNGVKPKIPSEIIRPSKEARNLVQLGSHGKSN